MKRWGILLITVMFGLVIACGSQEEKAPAKPAAPPEEAKKAAPQVPMTAPTPQASPATKVPQAPKAVPVPQAAPVAPAPQAAPPAPAPAAPVQPGVSAPVQAQYGYNYPLPPANPYAHPWVGPNTPWVYYKGDWFLKGLLYNFFGPKYGWAPYYAYPPKYIARPSNWYEPKWGTWYQRNPNYWKDFERAYPYWRGHREGRRYDQRFYEMHHRGQGAGWQKGFHRTLEEKPHPEVMKPGPGQVAPPEKRSQREQQTLQQQQRKQQMSIKQGVESGQLTPQEYRRLQEQLERLKAKEAKMKADGRLTPQERAKLQKEIDKINQKIYREKHDQQAVPGAAPPVR